MSKQRIGTVHSRGETGENPCALEIEIRREIYTDKSTVGRLFVNGEFECYTLEDCARPPGIKIAGSTCIPAGNYMLAINYSSRFHQLMPQLLEVPGFEGIRIHSGNTAADTEGCILVGQTRAQDFVGGSRAAFGELFGKLQAAKTAGGEVRVKIIDNGMSQPSGASAVSSVPAEPLAVKIIAMQVERWNAERDGALSEQALRRKLESLGYSVHRYTYPPGTFFAPHTHAEDKMDAVISGRFRIRMGADEVVLQEGDAVRVPRGTEHSAEVVGAQPVVSLDAVKVG